MVRKGRVPPKSTVEPKILNFYPNVGRLEDYAHNATLIFDRVESEAPPKAELVHWMVQRFEATSEFCRKLVETLARVGFVSRVNDAYRLGEPGKRFHETKDTRVLVDTLMEKVVAIQEIVEVLAGGEPVARDVLIRQVNERVKRPLPRNQFEHRFNWLRGLGFAHLIAGNLLLTEQGMRWWNDVQTRSAPPQRRVEISHNDIENKLQIIGEFFEFETTKRPSINQVLPSYALKLSEGDRQLDCLWVRYVHFGGQIKFPIEVHLSGNLADSLDRLETVSEYVQKAIIITTADQEKTIIDRLRVKRSRLLDKLVIVNVEEVYKVMEATNVIKSLSEKIFSD